MIAVHQVKAEIGCPGLAVVPGSHGWMIPRNESGPFEDCVATEGEDRKDERPDSTSIPTPTFCTNGKGVVAVRPARRNAL